MVQRAAVAARRAASMPFLAAVIGSGPAGFYTAHKILATVPSSRIDMYESRPVPFGLVRYGVAPDHPEVKNCQDRFDQIAQSERFRFIGNVAVGSPPHDSTQGAVELSTLRRHYDAIVLAYGASQDKTLGIPGEATLGGIYSAREFVGWYNAVPELSNLAPNLANGDEAVVIGHGNVALDVARILLTHVDTLRKTDIAERALETLAGSRIRRVHVVGRRGPIQASFTIKEVRELLRLPDVGFHPVKPGLVPSDTSGLARPLRRMMDIISEGGATHGVAAPRSWSLDFCLSPRRFLAKAPSPTLVSSTMFESMSLESDRDPGSKARPTGTEIELPSSVVFRSTGYKSAPLLGFAEAGLQFDDGPGRVQHDGFGRAIGPPSRDSRRDGEGARPIRVPGMYCTGWVKRGPTGVIASTMQDAFATADVISHDWISGEPFMNGIEAGRSGWPGVRQETRSLDAVKTVTWEDWKRIDRAERERGQARGKEREKFGSTGEMLAVLD